MSTPRRRNPITFAGLDTLPAGTMSDQTPPKGRGVILRSPDELAEEQALIERLQQQTSVEDLDQLQAVLDAPQEATESTTEEQPALVEDFASKQANNIASKLANIPVLTDVSQEPVIQAPTEATGFAEGTEAQPAPNWPPAPRGQVRPLPPSQHWQERHAATFRIGDDTQMLLAQVKQELAARMRLRVNKDDLTDAAIRLCCRQLMERGLDSALLQELMGGDDPDGHMPDTFASKLANLQTNNKTNKQTSRLESNHPSLIDNINREISISNGTASLQANKQNSEEPQEDRAIIRSYIADFAREMKDTAPTEASTSRAYKLYQRAGLPLTEFVAAMYTARETTRASGGAITRQMAYWFTCLEDCLGLRD